MEEWRNFFLQRMGTDANDSAYPVCESVDTWGVWCKEIPFIIYGKAKEPAKVSWSDEHGDDEFISDDGLYMDAYTMTVEFGCKMMTSVSDVRAKVKTFLDYLRTSGMMKMYSSHTRTGRQYVRFSSVSDDAKWKSKKEWRVVSGTRTLVTVKEWLIFKVTFKVNDPVTDVTLTVADGGSSSS